MHTNFSTLSCTNCGCSWCVFTSCASWAACLSPGPRVTSGSLINWPSTFGPRTKCKSSPILYAFGDRNQFVDVPHGRPPPSLVFYDLTRKAVSAKLRDNVCNSVWKSHCAPNAHFTSSDFSSKSRNPLTRFIDYEKFSPLYRVFLALVRHWAHTIFRCCDYSQVAHCYASRNLCVGKR